MKNKIAYILAPITIFGCTWTGIEAAHAEEPPPSGLEVSATVPGSGSTADQESISKLTRYVRHTVLVKHGAVEYHPERWSDSTVDVEMKDYVSKTVDELNSQDAAKGMPDGADPMTVSYEKTYETIEDEDPISPAQPGVSTAAGEEKWFNGHITVTGGFVHNYHFDQYATAQVQKWSGLGGGAGLSAGKAIAKRLGISAIPLIGQVLTLVAAGTAVCTNSDGTMDIKIPEYPPVAYCNPFK